MLRFLSSNNFLLRVPFNITYELRICITILGLLIFQLSRDGFLIQFRGFVLKPNPFVDIGFTNTLGLFDFADF